VPCNRISGGCWDRHVESLTPGTPTAGRAVESRPGGTVGDDAAGGSAAVTLRGAGDEQPATSSSAAAVTAATHHRSCGVIPDVSPGMIRIMTVVTGQRGALGLAALLTTTGILHFLLPRPFVTIVPRALPHKEALVAASGVAELVCAGLLVAPGTRRAGGAASATVLLAVFPANASMALRSTRRSRWYRAAVWARLPLQVPLIWWGLRIARPRPPR